MKNKHSSIFWKKCKDIFEAMVLVTQHKAHNMRHSECEKNAKILGSWNRDNACREFEKTAGKEAERTRTLCIWTFPFLSEKVYWTWH